MTMHRVFRLPVASVYPLYEAKVEKKGRTKAELDEVIRWLTGFDETELQARRGDRGSAHAEDPLPRQARGRTGARQGDGEGAPHGMIAGG